MKTYIGIFILSLILYLFAPNQYSLIYCTILLAIFIFSSILFLRITKNRTYFNFHFLFLLSMFFVNFVYPVFLRQISEAYFQVFNIPFNDNVITKSTALVLLGINSYMLGSLNAPKQRIQNHTVRPAKKYSYNKLTQLLLFISYSLFILFLLFVGSEFFKGIFGAYNNISIYILMIFQPIIYLTTIISVLNMEKKNNMSFISYLKGFKLSLNILLFLFITSFLFVGDRGPVLYLIVIIIGLYSFLINPLKLSKILPVLIIGMFVMTFISYARTTTQQSTINLDEYINRGNKNMNINSFFDIGMDLIVNNRNLYVGVDYTDKHGINYGKTMFLYPLSVIPGLQGLVVKLVGVDPETLSTAYVITNTSFGDRKGWGLGTTNIVDIYFAFGTIGVIILMFIFGFLMQKLENLFIAIQSPELIILYITMLSLAIYLPRAEFLQPLRPLFWTYITFSLLKPLLVVKAK